MTAHVIAEECECLAAIARVQATGEATLCTRCGETLAPTERPSHVGLARSARVQVADGDVLRPSSTPPVIWPRSAILHSAAASMVEGIFEVTVSTADSTATFGRSMPRSRARSMAFWQMSTLSSRVGKMLTAASVTRSGFG